MRHSELPEHLCSGQLDGLLGEGLIVCQCGRGGFRRAHGEECVLAGSYRAEGCSPDGGTGGSDVGGGVGDWDAGSGEAVEDPRCTGAGDPSSASGYATADESLATGSN